MDSLGIITEQLETRWSIVWSNIFSADYFIKCLQPLKICNLVYVRISTSKYIPSMQKILPPPLVNLFLLIPFVFCVFHFPCLVEVVSGYSTISELISRSFPNLEVSLTIECDFSKLSCSHTSRKFQSFLVDKYLFIAIEEILYHISTSIILYSPIVSRTMKTGNTHFFVGAALRC